jgi:hypothetical protein
VWCVGVKSSIILEKLSGDDVRIECEERKEWGRRDKYSNIAGGFVRASARVTCESRGDGGMKEQTEKACAERQGEIAKKSCTFWTIRAAYWITDFFGIADDR